MFLERIFMVNRSSRLGSTGAGALTLLLLLPGALAAPKSSPPPKLNVQEAPINRDQKFGLSFAPVVKKVAPSVVNIYSSMTIKERPMANPFTEDPFFRRFFGDDFGQQQQQAQPRERKAQSLGSGVIVSPDGYILTANHVVEGAEQVKVSLASTDSKEFEAKIIGTDAPTDMAVLKIEGHNLPSIALADSDKLEVGDIV